MSTKAELLEAVAELREYDHAFVSPKGAKRLAKPFGVKPTTYLVQANPNDPKGLTLDDGATEAEGVDAAILAEQICHKLGVNYESKLGRGSQLRSCCDALQKWAEDQPDA